MLTGLIGSILAATLVTLATSDLLLGLATVFALVAISQFLEHAANIIIKGMGR